MKFVLAILLAPVAVLAAERRSVSEDLDKQLIAPLPTQWLKTYALSPYKEHWSVDLEVKDYQKDTRKIVKLFEKAGASLTQPLDLFPVSRTEKSQQLSFRSSRKSAQTALKALRKAAVVNDSRQRPAAEPVSLAEVNSKIEKLAADREAHAQELAGMPAVSAVVEELFSHLLSVRAVQERADSEVLINVLIKEKR